MERQSGFLLLVEDETIIALASKRSLEKYGYTVLTADSGETALALFAQSEAIDLVLMDIDLGEGIDGAETASLMLKSRMVPIVFLSSHSESSFVDRTRQITSYGYVVKNSGITVLDMSIKTALKLFEGNAALAKEKAQLDTAKESLFEAAWKFHALFEKGPLGVAYHKMIYDENGKAVDYRFIDANEQYRELTGVDPRGKTVLEAFPGIEKDTFDWIGTFDTVVHTGEPVRFEQYLENNRRWYDCAAYRYNDGCFVVAFLEITKRKEAETAWKQSELKYRSLIEFSSDVVFCVDKSGSYQFVNQVFASTFGKTPDYFIGKTYWDIYPKEHADHRQATSKKVFETGETQTTEVIVPLPDKNLYFLAKANPVKDDKGCVVLCLVHATDITERKIAEEKIQTLLEEKEMILKEVHHRIKNNMNTLSSLLILQAGFMKDDGAVKALEDAESRVQSMMVLYDRLYQSADFSEISLAEYLPPLIVQIMSNFPESMKVRIEMDIGEFTLPVKQVQPLGIIVNELLTNVMKYAFSGNEGGVIKVSASLLGKRVHITIEDNGKGMPESVSFHDSASFGLQLVNGLIKQLRGTIRIERIAGTRIHLEFDHEHN